MTATAGMTTISICRFSREKYLDPRISFNSIPPEEMRSFPYDSKELDQVWPSVLENLAGSRSSFLNGFDESNEDPFTVFQKPNEDLVRPLEKRADACTSTWGVAASIISGVVGTAAIVIVVYFLIDCLKKSGTAIPSYARIATNDSEKFTKDSSSSRLISDVAPAISPGHNREKPDEFNTLERFLKPTWFSSEQLAVCTRDYATVLGSGTYGVVFKGELPDGTLVAVKVLKNAYDKRMEELFMAEVSSIGRTHHINLVRLYSFCFNSTRRALVYEYMENGSLDGFHVLNMTTTAGITTISVSRLSREKYLDPRISFNSIPPEEMRSFPYDSEVLNQFWPSLLENLASPWSYSHYQIGFSKSNEVRFNLIQKNNEDPSRPLIIRSDACTSTWGVAASIIFGMVGTAAIVIVVYFLIDCLKKVGTVIASYARIATNDLEKFPKDSSSSRLISVVAPAISPGYNQEFGTLERFLKPTWFSSEQLAVCTRDYATMLGSGTYGVVLKGQLPDGTLVAVKVLKNAHDNRMEELFMAEVSTIGRTHHINLVKLYGFCFDPTTRALVYEYMENGSLDGFLSGDKVAIDWSKMQKIAVGTAKGIAYLHEECEQRIVHCDIKPGNILLDQNLSPKVADFGLAKLYSREISWIPMSGFRGTHGYAAPEMSKPYPVTYKCDVYSFGMVLFDIVGRRINHDMNPSESMLGLPQCTWHMLRNGKLLEMVCGFPETEREKAMRMLMVALWCIQNEPEARPTMSTVVKMLEGDVGIPTPEYPFENPNPNKPSQGSGNGSEWESNSSASRIGYSRGCCSEPVKQTAEIELATG